MSNLVQYISCHNHAFRLERKKWLSSTAGADVCMGKLNQCEQNLPILSLSDKCARVQCLVIALGELWDVGILQSIKTGPSTVI